MTTRCALALRTCGAILAIGLFLSTSCDHTSTGDSNTFIDTRMPRCANSTGRDTRATVDGSTVLVHLPACYDDTADTRYPVVILLHGAGADETQWTDVGAVAASDQLVADGTVGPFILVLPRAVDTRSPQQAQMAAMSIVPWVDQSFRTIRDRSHRAIGGISRGGGAALLAAARWPGLFGIVGGHSPTVPEPTSLLDGLRAQSGSIWLDVGTGDALLPDVSDLARLLRGGGIDVEFHSTSGEHDRTYWRAHIAEYLQFYAGRWR